MPFFSVIIPVFNRALAIQNAIESLLKQSFSDFEVIVVDDGSTDALHDVILRYKDNLQVKYIYQENKGVSSARNYGADFSKGDYLVFLDSDDAVSETWLKDYSENISRTKAEIVFCKMESTFPNGLKKIIDPRDPYNNGKEYGIFIPGTFTLTKKLFLAVGSYDENLKYGENTELSFRLKNHCSSISFVDNVNLFYRASSDGGSKNWNNKLNANLYILEKHKDFFRNQSRVRQLYLGVAAVAAVHCKKIKLAQTLFLKSFLVYPIRLKPLLQFCISMFPFVAFRFWVRYK